MEIPYPATLQDVADELQAALRDEMEGEQHSKAGEAALARAAYVRRSRAVARALGFVAALLVEQPNASPSPDGGDSWVLSVPLAEGGLPS